MSNEHMCCVWCGTKGGFVNRLIVHLIRDGGGIIECEWCLMARNNSAIRVDNE